MKYIIQYKELDNERQKALFKEVVEELGTSSLHQLDIACVADYPTRLKVMKQCLRNACYKFLNKIADGIQD